MAQYPSPAEMYRRPQARSNWPIYILAVLMAGLAWWYAEGRAHRVNNPDAAPRPITARGNLAEYEKTTIELFRQCAPAVVHTATLAG